MLDEEIILTKSKGFRTLESSQRMTDTLTTSVPESSTTFENSAKVVDRTESYRKMKVRNIRYLASEIQNVSFDVNSMSKLDDAELTMRKVLQSLLESCSYEAGLRVTAKPQRKSLKNKRKASECVSDELPRKYAKINPYASRHGAVADIMKPLHSVTTLFPVISNKTENRDEITTKKSASIMTVKKKHGNVNKQLNMEQVESVRITPPAAIRKFCKLTDCLLQNGPHRVSMVHIKSLEPNLSRIELVLLKAQDKHFCKGWLYDEIINSYLWQICRQYNNCLYVCSSTALLLQKHSCIKRLRNGIDLGSKKLMFIPWNPNNMHWILLAVDIDQKKLLYLDPMERPCLTTSESVADAKDLVNYLLSQKFHCNIKSVEATTRSMQKGTESCGVYICMYAKCLAKEEDLCNLRSYSTPYRKEIFEKIAGNCLQDKCFNKKECRVCHGFDFVKEYITCTRCKQKYHIQCLRLGERPSSTNDYDAHSFIC